MNICAYAAYYDNEIRQKSSSGAIFSLVASRFDVIYGVAMTDDCYGANFIRSEKYIDPIRGSKYLQASMGDTFVEVKKDLKSGKRVLFTGTGCQVNGLKKYLNTDYDNLLCVDVICHGVPSPALWEIYIKYQEKQLCRRKIESVNFRCKENSWKDYGMKENEFFISKDVDPYMQMFLRDYCLRPSCYECRAKNNKKSDITIADFWGIENVAPEMDDGKGTSLVIVRTRMGAGVFEDIRDKLKYRKVSYEDAVRQNPSEYSSVKRPKQRDMFFEDMRSMDFADLSRKYVASYRKTLVMRMKLKLKTILKRIGEKVRDKR